MISATTYTRLSRTSMVEVLGEDYIRTARSKGLSERRLVLRHALRSALTPVVTQFGVDVAVGLGGAILTERVSVCPGWDASLCKPSRTRTSPSSSVLVANILVDIAYATLAREYPSADRD